MQYKLGFIGAGNMAEAIISAALKAKVLQPNQIIAADLNEQRRKVMSNLGIDVTKNNSEVLQKSEQILLAIKPQQMESAAKDIAQYGAKEQVIISIMAGISTAKLSDAIGRKLRIVRIMPNTPVMVGCGMAGIALGEAAQENDDALAMQLFSAAGKAVRVEESKLDAITAVSGSGPAYLFYLAEAMQEAANQLGLGEYSELLANQTILGAAQLLAQSSDSAPTLCQKVKSPGGTTEAALNKLDGNSARQIIIDAIKAANNRSIELGL